MHCVVRDSKRAERKLNFLITQTELYAHFMQNKSRLNSAEFQAKQEKILGKLDDENDSHLFQGAESQQALRAAAVRDANTAFERAKTTVQAFPTHLDGTVV